MRNFMPPIINHCIAWCVQKLPYATCTLNLHWICIFIWIDRRKKKPFERWSIDRRRSRARNNTCRVPHHLLRSYLSWTWKTKISRVCPHFYYLWDPRSWCHLAATSNQPSVRLYVLAGVVCVAIFILPLVLVRMKTRHLLSVYLPLRYIYIFLICVLFLIDRVAVIMLGIITLIAGVLLSSLPWLDYFILKVSIYNNLYNNK